MLNIAHEYTDTVSYSVYETFRSLIQVGLLNESRAANI